MRILIAVLLLMTMNQAGAIGYDGNGSTFSLADLQALLSAPNGPKTLEDVLNQIHTESPNLFEDFVLMYRSKSFQASSKAQPRVILANNDASFALTFNGNPSQRGFDRLEVMQFDPKESRFQFREVTVVDGRAQLGPANPKLCLACHQSEHRETIDPRPNWEPYSRWPGAIGSEQGRFVSGHQKEIYSQEDSLHLTDTVSEEQILKDFVENSRPGHPRYELLELPLDYARYFDSATRLTDRLGRLNFRRVMRLAKEDWPQHFEQVKDVFEAGLVCSDTFYVDKSVLSVVENRTPEREDEFVVDHESLIRVSGKKSSWSYAGGGDEFRKKMRRIDPPQYPRIRVSEMLYLLFQPYGVDITDWSMDFHTGGRLAFQERFGIPSNPQAAAKEAYLAVHPEREQIRSNCLEVIAKAIEQSKRLLELPTRPAPSAKPLINRCISCHSDSFEEGAPEIPFDNPVLLKSALYSILKNGRTLLEDIEFRLSDHATLDEQMPKGLTRPSRTERIKLIQYLKGL